MLSIVASCCCWSLFSTVSAVIVIVVAIVIVVVVVIVDIVVVLDLLSFSVVVVVVVVVVLLLFFLLFLFWCYYCYCICYSCCRCYNCCFCLCCLMVLLLLLSPFTVVVRCCCSNFPKVCCLLDVSCGAGCASARSLPLFMVFLHDGSCRMTTNLLFPQHPFRGIVRFCGCPILPECGVNGGSR